MSTEGADSTAFSACGSSMTARVSKLVGSPRPSWVSGPFRTAVVRPLLYLSVARTDPATPARHRRSEAAFFASAAHIAALPAAATFWRARAPPGRRLVGGSRGASGPPAAAFLIPSAARTAPT